VLEHRAREAVDLDDQQPPFPGLRARSAPKAPHGAVERPLAGEDEIV
jgi:hypothetical protein